MTTYGPYTPVQPAGNFLFVSGQVGVDAATAVAPLDVASQTTLALRNMETLLHADGAAMNDVVKTTVFLTDMGNFSVMNEAYERAFIAPRPARSTVAVRELPRVGGDVTLLVEIEAVAYKESQ